MTGLLSGLRVLILEDEALIAMDVEQLCRDHGATDVTIVSDLRVLETGPALVFDAAVIDVMLQGASTFAFAAQLHDRNVPFVFASGYTDSRDLAHSFPGVTLVGKPYSGDDLVTALATACGRA